MSQSFVKKPDNGPHSALSNLGVLASEQPAMTREEWIDRYAKRIQERAGWTAEEARRAAEVGANEYERMERAAHNAVVWGTPTSPEDDADDEMSYWENDGED